MLPTLNIFEWARYQARDLFIHSLHQLIRLTKIDAGSKRNQLGFSVLPLNKHASNDMP